MGRKKEIRGTWVHLRLTPSEKSMVTQRAELENLTASELLRDGLAHVLSRPVRGPFGIIGAGDRTDQVEAIQATG